MAWYRSADRALVTSSSSSQRRKAAQGRRGERDREPGRLKSSSEYSARRDDHGRRAQARHLQQAQRQQSLGHGACPALETQPINQPIPPNNEPRNVLNAVSVAVATSMRNVLKATRADCCARSSILLDKLRLPRQQHKDEAGLWVSVDSAGILKPGARMAPSIHPHLIRFLRLLALRL